MLIELNPFWAVIVNVAACFGLQMGIAWGCTQLPFTLFKPQTALFRKRAWEQDGRSYENVFLIRKWKKLLPDGAAWFKGGFPKKNLRRRDAEYFRRFALETCRGELAHWLQIAVVPVFFLWNPAWAGCVIVVYFLLTNIPCILAQRYNRIRLDGSRVHKGTGDRGHMGEVVRRSVTDKVWDEV